MMSTSNQLQYEDEKGCIDSLGLILMGCGKKEPLTPEQQWHGYCVSIGNAARSIALDRQNGIEEKQAKEHASKVEDIVTGKQIGRAHV